MVLRCVVPLALWGAFLASGQATYVDKVVGVGAPTNFGGDLGPAIKAQLNDPTCLAMDSAGNLYIAAFGNSRVLKVDSFGTLTTFAGIGLNVLGGDGGAATLAGIGKPAAVAVDASGNVYVAEMGSNRIRKVTPQKGDTQYFPSTTVAETWTTSTTAISSPFGVAIDASSSLYIADADNGRILQVRTSGDTRKRWPHIEPTYVVNGATFIATPVCPGELLTVYGDDLGPLAGASTEIDGARLLSKTLSGAQVFFDGVAAPILYAQTGQLNVAAPYAITGKSVTEAWVVRDGLESNHVLIPVLGAAPGIFATTADFRMASALNQDNTMNDIATNPTLIGNIFVLFATGGGQTIPPGTDGLPANGPYPAPVLPVSVRIGDMDAEVLYAGAAPGFIAGAMQINAQVPAGLFSVQTTGGYIAEVIVTIGGVRSRTNLYIAVKP